MLKAYIDGSGTGDARLLVLAGYLSTVERWAAFSDEWQRLIDMRSPHYRALEYFKMHEMKSDADLERCGWFYRVIEEHALAAISVAVDVQVLREEAAARDWKAKVGNSLGLINPYFIAFDFITTGLAQHSAHMGIIEPVDFIFDEESEKGLCIAAWEAIKRTAKPDIQKFLGDTPSYRDDLTTLPLQAADLWAYWVREWHLNGIADGVEDLRFPWEIQNKDFLRLHMIFDRTKRSEVGKYLSDPRVLALNDFSEPPSSLSEMKKD